MTETVRHNMGTVGEHIALCCATDWACEFSKEVGPIRYIDTHAMAPLNRPVGNDFDLVNKLSDQFRCRIPDEAQYGTRSYFDLIRRATQFLRDRDMRAWYPTHFLHAWAAARGRGVAFDALLFENDSEGEGRRECLFRFLPIANFLLCEGAEDFTATLADYPGDFRSEASWPAAAPKPGRALVIMNDPLQVHQQYRGGSYMDLSDFGLIQRRLEAVAKP